MVTPVENLKQVRHMDNSQPFDDWLENCRPAIAIDVISASTRVDDFVMKSTRYAKSGVAEFYIFDPQSKLLDTPVQAFCLQDWNFVALNPAEEKTIYIGPVEIHMRREGIFLRAVDPAPGKIAPNYDEILTNLGAVMYRAEVAEAENLRLRELLATYQSKGTDS